MSRETIMIIFQPDGHGPTIYQYGIMLHHLQLTTWICYWIEVLFKKLNKYILRIVTSSVFTWINMLSLVCINISHLVSGFCPGQWHCVQPRDSQHLHITFMTFLCLWLYCILLMWLVETFQPQATVIICIKAQIVLAGVSSKQAGPTPTYHCTGNTGMFKLNIIKCFAGRPGVNWCGYDPASVRTTHHATPPN